MKSCFLLYIAALLIILSAALINKKQNHQHDCGNNQQDAEIGVFPSTRLRIRRYGSIRIIGKNVKIIGFYRAVSIFALFGGDIDKSRSPLDLNFILKILCCDYICRAAA